MAGASYRIRICSDISLGRTSWSPVLALQDMETALDAGLPRPSRDCSCLTLCPFSWNPALHPQDLYHLAPAFPGPLDVCLRIRLSTGFAVPGAQDVSAFKQIGELDILSATKEGICLLYPWRQAE